MFRPTVKVEAQIKSAYRRMSTEAKYRPSAPSDGFGNITAPIERLDLEAEAGKYVDQWWNEEDNWEFFIGCCDFRTRSATIFAIEAARLMCGGFSVGAALKLISMAAGELKNVLSIETKTPKPKRSAISDSLRYRIMRRDRFCCVLCGATGKETLLVIDHIVPVSKNGMTRIDNLRTLCQSCNQGKGAKLE